MKLYVQWFQWVWWIELFVELIWALDFTKFKVDFKNKCWLSNELCSEYNCWKRKYLYRRCSSIFLTKLAPHFLLLLALISFHLLNKKKIFLFFSSLLIFMASSGDTCINILGPAQLQNVAQKFHEAIIQIGFRSFGLQEKNSFYITRRGRKTNSIYNTFA